MFADSAKIYIRSGKGGDGHVSFRRELFVAAGGPDGGDGGRGGDVIFEVDDGLNTLTDFRHVRKYVAGDGEQGGKRRCHGADGEDLIVKVPEGTVIKDFESGKVIADMSGENRREVILIPAVPRVPVPAVPAVHTSEPASSRSQSAYFQDRPCHLLKSLLGGSRRTYPRLPYRIQNP